MCGISDAIKESQIIGKISSLVLSLVFIAIGVFCFVCCLVYIYWLVGKGKIADNIHQMIDSNLILFKSQGWVCCCCHDLLIEDLFDWLVVLVGWFGCSLIQITIADG